MSNSPAQWQELQRLFKRAMQRPAPDRSAFLDEACGDDKAMRQRLERLVEAHAKSERVLEPPAARGLALRPGDIVGRYRIVRLIAEGGMGVVYEAQQEHPSRTVALKAIRPGLTTPELHRRFEHEAQLLGRLNHPGIAQIHEAVTADGDGDSPPYFAMELVRGPTLTEYARNRDLNLAQRLELLLQVCAAVQHAHEHGVIHRDLKPANILVDESGHARVLDFGVARLVDDDVRLSTLHTSPGQFIGTLAYMSPEQVDGRPGDTGVRSDIYALGVIGYELLVGRIPLDLRGRSLAEAARMIRHDDPPSASTFQRDCRGDLDTILAKTMAKDPEQRYDSVAAMANDMRRFLLDQPISARPPNTLYQLRKFVRRHKPLVIGTAAAFALLVAGIVGTSIGMVRARAEAHNARTILAFVEGLLSDANPWSGRDPDLTIRAALARTEEQLAELDFDPVIEARIRETIGSVYRGLGLADEAEPHFRRALVLREQFDGPTGPETLRTMLNLALVLSNQNQLDEAESLSREVLEIQSAAGREGETTYLAHAYLGNILSEARRSAEALSHTQAALDGLVRLYGPDDPRTLTRVNDVGLALMDLGRLDDAERMLRRAIEGRKRVLGPNAPDTFITMDLLGIVLKNAGRPDEARAVFEQAVQGLREALGPDHFETLRAEHNYAMFLMEQGSLDQAETIARRVLDKGRRVLDPGHDDLLGSVNCLARIELARERFESARSLFTENLEAIHAKHGPDHLFAAYTTRSLADCDESVGELERAAERYREALGIFEANLPHDHWTVAQTRARYGELLRRLERYEAAEAALKSSLADLRPQFGLDGELTQSTIESLVSLYESWGRDDLADQFRDLRHASQ